MTLRFSVLFFGSLRQTLLPPPFFLQTYCIFLKYFLLTRSVAFDVVNVCHIWLHAAFFFYCVLKPLRDFNTFSFFSIKVRHWNRFACFLTRESTVVLRTNRLVFFLPGLARRWQANNVTTLAVTKVDYGLLAVGKQRNSTVSLNVTRHQMLRRNARRWTCRYTMDISRGALRASCYDLISRRLRDRKEALPPVVIT